jgi:cytochrome c peroxidase
MHDGSEQTLVEVVEFYDRGGVKNPNLSQEVKPLGLSAQEKRDLVAFLEALTGPVNNAAPPASLPQ